VDALVTFFEEKPDSEAYFAILEVDGNAKVFDIRP
jgi:alanyl-tRNA synthetase